MASNVNNIITDLEQQRDAIDRALEALREIAGASGGQAAAVKAPAKVASQKQQSGDEARNKRSEGQRRRWAAKRAEGPGTSSKRGQASGQGSGLTAAGRKRLSELMKARWASRNPPKKKARS